jgi:DUF3006 family protein
MEAVKASLDRFEGDYAVVYSYNNSRKFDVSRKLLGEDVKPGMRLVLHLDGDKVSSVEIDKHASSDAKDRIRRKYLKLRRRARK